MFLASDSSAEELRPKGTANLGSPFSVREKKYPNGGNSEIKKLIYLVTQIYTGGF